MQRVSPYQSGNQVWKDEPSVGNQVSNNGNQSSQDATPTSHTKTDSSTSLPHMMDMAMRNLKLTPSKGKLSHNWKCSTGCGTIFSNSQALAKTN